MSQSPSMGCSSARSMERTLADLTAKDKTLPANDPRRSTLDEMIQRLKDEIGARKQQARLKAGAG